jgi:hypothetical protein
MTLTLLNPSLVWLGLALLGLPVLAHLFARAKPKELVFPSLQWLRHVERKTTNLRKPKDRWLLVLRALAVAAIVAAFLQPLLFSGARLAAAGAPKTVVLVIDRTASMAFVEEGQSRFARAAGRAESVLRSAGPRTVANVVWLDASPQAEFPDPGVNLDVLRDALRRAQVVLEAGDIRQAMRVAVEQLGRGEGAKELHLVSDFQSSAWKDVPLDLPPDVSLVTLPVAGADAGNLSLASLVVEPERPVRGTEARVLCRVRNFSEAEARTTVQAAFAETRQTRPVTVPPWGEAVAEFRVPCGAAGWHGLTAFLPEDAFPADDRRFATVEVLESRRAQVEGPAGDATLALWRRALESFGWLEVREAGGDGEADVIVAVRADPGRAAALREAAADGATVLCLPGEDWKGSPWMAFWSAGAREADLRVEHRDRDREPPWTAAMVREDHPLWQVFRGGEFGDPASGAVWRRMRVAPDEESALLRYEDGVPALAARRVGKGWTILWNLELDEAVSDRVLQPSFLILAGELLQQHAEVAGSSALRHFDPSRTVFWQPPQPVAADQVRLRLDAGDDLPFGLDETASPPVFRARDALPPGNYHWTVDGQIAERASVNFPADEESDLRTLDPATMGRGQTLSAGAVARLAARREGFPIWPWCVGIALSALVLEGVVARGALRTPVPSRA